MLENIKVSVLMITYNHKDFIEQAIKSVLNQKTNFQIELVIGDDVSTDGTLQICKKFQQQHPETIKLLKYKKNVGVTQNFINVYNACKGEFIAILEGDDYWIDNNKLQMQYDYLTQNNRCALVYTLSRDYYSDKKTFKINSVDEPSEIDFLYLLRRGWFIRTATIMFRKNLDLNYWKDVNYSLDYLIHFLCSLKGSINKLNFVTTVYRRHIGGITNVTVDKQLIRMKWFNDLLNRIDVFSEKKFSNEIKQTIKNNNSEIIYISIRNFKFGYLLELKNANISLVIKMFFYVFANKFSLIKKINENRL
jgi:glycosyltransferase involved in cell wall biosynthesis